jgi:hypothetical protein
MILTRTISLSVAAFTALLSLNVHANELMSKAQYADYSVRYQCAQLRFHDDLAKQGEEIVKIETDFGLNEDNFEAFDELVQAYEKDDALLDDIRARVSKECI